MNTGLIYKLAIRDTDSNWENDLGTYYLVDPDMEKLKELKRLIETRWDDEGDEKYCDWGEIEEYIQNNFTNSRTAGGGEKEMIYVYCRRIDSGREELCRICDTWEEAIEQITRLYNLNMMGVGKGQYYYFAKR